MKNSYIAIVAVIIVVLIGWAIADRRANPSAGTNGSPVSSAALTASDWVKGNKDARVVLIEYSDFQCPACRTYYPVVKQLTAELGDRVAFVYRHFPLRSIHANAEMAARAAEAAGKQEKFWEMHDRLFEKQDVWAPERSVQETFAFYAGELGLNVEQFKNDMKSGEVKDAVSDDYASGTAAQVNGTPTFFVNGKRIQPPPRVADFKALIENELQAQ